MKNIVGQTPRGKDFFKRNHIINKTYRRLDAGNHLFLSAPRRAGKTSIMRFLEDAPNHGYAFIYANTEDIQDAEDFFKLVSEKLVNSTALVEMIKASKDSKNVFAQFIDKFNKIKLGALEVEFNGKKPSNYKTELSELLKKLDTDKFKIIIMLDEFPVTIENIKNTQDEQAAINFLQANRNLRQEASRGIQFIYTGSIGLPTIAGRLKATSTLNDLNTVEIPPLSRDEATLFAQKILDHYDIKYELDAIKYLLEKLQWLMPFYIQLVLQVLIDEAFESDKTIDIKAIDKAIQKSSSHRSNLYFENYWTRLEKSLSRPDIYIAQDILRSIAQQSEVPKGNLGSSNQTKGILEMLEIDGYINLFEGKYRFNSPILRDWWKKYA